MSERQTPERLEPSSDPSRVKKDRAQEWGSDDTKLEYVNQMSTSSSELCVDGPCMNMTNLHFHGLHVSPRAPGDDVLTMMAMPGESLHYTVDIPADQPPGLYWYHTHPHGESYQQDLDGMSGANRDRRDRSALSREQEYEGEDSNPSRR